MLTRATFAVLAVSLFASHATAEHKDYLARSWSEQPLDFEIQYENAIRRILEKGFRENVVLRTAMLPPFNPGGIVGIVQSPAGYRAFDLQRSFQIWDALHEHKAKLPKIRSIYRERVISGNIAARLATLWRRVLADRSNYRPPEKGVIFVDSTSFVFYVGASGGPSLTANTDRFDRGTKTWEVISVGDAIYHYVHRDASEAQPEQRLREAEAKVGVTSSRAKQQIPKAF